MIRELILDASKSRTVTTRLAHSGLARRATTRFMPGEDLDDALAAAEQLWSEGIPTVLTRLGEHVLREQEADEAAQHYLQAIGELEARELPGELSVKLSQLGLGLGSATAGRNLRVIAARAARADRPVWIDMEDGTTTDATLDLFEELSGEFGNLGLCLQANLRRTTDDLERLLPLGPRIRLVKGAYSEPAAIAFQGREEIGRAYLRVAGLLLSWAAAGRVEPVFATHDTALLSEIAALAQSLGTAVHGYEIHMLYGIRAEEQRRLHNEGARVRVLVSYGPDWAAWYLRRLAERPANVILAASAFLPHLPSPGGHSTKRRGGTNGRSKPIQEVPAAGRDGG